MTCFSSDSLRARKFTRARTASTSRVSTARPRPCSATKGEARNTSQARPSPIPMRSIQRIGVGRAAQNRCTEWGARSPMAVKTRPTAPSPMATKASTMALVITAAEASTMAIWNAAEATS